MDQLGTLVGFPRDREQGIGERVEQEPGFASPHGMCVAMLHPPETQTIRRMRRNVDAGRGEMRTKQRPEAVSFGLVDQLVPRPESVHCFAEQSNPGGVTRR